MQTKNEENKSLPVKNGINPAEFLKNRNSCLKKGFPVKRIEFHGSRHRG